MCIFRKYKKEKFRREDNEQHNHDSLIFGFIRLYNEEDTKAVEGLMKENFLNGSIGDLTVSHGIIATVGFAQRTECILTAGFCTSLREVEYNSVIHISIQFWEEPWFYGMEDENSDIRSGDKTCRSCTNTEDT